MKFILLTKKLRGLLHKMNLFTTDPALTRGALSVSAKMLGNPEIAVPRKIQFMETLPLLGTGKTDYVTLKRMAEALC